jgi:hypothetical protein
MGKKFMEVLALSENTGNKVSLFQVEPLEVEDKEYFKLYFEAHEKLSLANIVELMRKITLIHNHDIRYERIRIRATDVFVVNNKEVEKPYELYEFVRFIYPQFGAVKHQEYFVEIENGEATLVASKEKTKAKLEKYLPAVKMFLNNFGV